MNLNKETIELIESQLLIKMYPNNESAITSIVEQCLTNPSILKSANLYTQEDCLGFAEFCGGNFGEYYENMELWTIFIQQKNC